MEKFTVSSNTIYFIVENSVHTAYVHLGGLQDNVALVDITRKLNLLESCVRSSRMKERELTQQRFERFSSYVAHLADLCRTAKAEGATAICLVYAAITCLDDLRFTLNSIAIANNLKTVY